MIKIEISAKFDANGRQRRPPPNPVYAANSKTCRRRIELIRDRGGIITVGPLQNSTRR